MKTVKIFGLCLLLFITGICSTTAQITLGPNQIPYTCKFLPKNSGPALTTLVNASKNPASYYKVFLSTGDGYYFSGDYLNPLTAGSSTDLAKFTYTYTKQGTYHPYAEFVEVYDDGEKPGRKVAANLQITAATQPTALRVPTGIIQMAWARKVVADHKNTYAVTIYNNSTSTQPWVNYKVTFTYSSQFFLQESGFNPNANPMVPSIKNNLNLLTVTLPSIPKGTQTTVYFPLITKATVAVGTPVTGLTATLYTRDGIKVAETAAKNVSVATSHDPNQKTPSLTSVPIEGGWIEYRIDFQNDGVSDALNVHVTDELELSLQNAPQFVDASHPTLVNQTPVQVAPRVWQWTFKQINLMGTNDSRYTPDQEWKTQGWIKFKVQAKQTSACQAIVNRARIVFDCNPPIYTNFAFSRVICDISGMECQEATAPTWLPTISSPAPGASITSLLDATLINTLRTGQYTCKWYPTTRLTAPFDAGAGVSMARPETYALVASRSCERKIYYVTVSPGGNGADAPILVEDSPKDCVGNLTVSGGEPPYTFEWNWQEGLNKMLHVQSGGTQMDLSNKNNVRVTVTDARGCSVVFSPAKTECQK